jgi:hypothetical protein
VRIPLTFQDEHVPNYTKRVVGSRAWGRYAPEYRYGVRCSCGEFVAGLAKDDHTQDREGIRECYREHLEASYERHLDEKPEKLVQIGRGSAKCWGYRQRCPWGCRWTYVRHSAIHGHERVCPKFGERRAAQHFCNSGHVVHGAVPPCAGNCNHGHRCNCQTHPADGM